MANKRDRIKTLRGMVSDITPTVTKANWSNLNNAGWRFECNLSINDEDAVTTLRNLQIRCGKDNVATGHTFPDERTEPHPTSDTIGVYIKDVDDLTSTMVAALNDEEKLAAWLSN
jgi:hypothetical protein